MLAVQRSVASSAIRMTAARGWWAVAAAVPRQRTFAAGSSSDMYPANLKYTKDHEWVAVDGAGVGTVGVTHHAQDLLGEVVYVDMPEAGSTVAFGEAFGTVESVKSASDLYSPVTGEVTEVNEELSDEPGAINKSPYGKGWIVKVKMSNPKELDSLFSQPQYLEFLKNAAH